MSTGKSVLTIASLLVFATCNADPLSPTQRADIKIRIDRAPSIELAPIAAAMVLNTPRAQRKEIAVEVVKAAICRRPALGPSIVIAISRAAPELAPIVAATALKITPEKRDLIARAVLRAAPQFEQSIVAALDYNEIARTQTVITLSPPLRSVGWFGFTKASTPATGGVITTSKVPIGSGSGGPIAFPPDSQPPTPQIFIADVPPPYPGCVGCRTYPQ